MNMMNLDDLEVVPSGLTAEEVAAAIFEAEKWLEHSSVLEYCLIGSAAYLPNPRDVDYLVMSDAVPELVTLLVNQGAEFCNAEYDKETHKTVRLGHLNFLIYDEDNVSEYRSYRQAMEVCRALKLVKKSDRRLVCRIIRDGLSEEDARELALARMELDE